MGAVITVWDKPDRAKLLPPEGIEVGMEMYGAVFRYLEGLERELRIENMQRAVDAGRPLDRYGYDQAIMDRSKVPEELIPRDLVIQAGATLPDFYSNFGFFFVSTAFKNLVQEFDGDVHQFTPVKIVDETGAPYEKSEFFYFKNCQILNTVDDTKPGLYFSKSILRRAKPGDPMPFTLSSTESFSVFGETVGGAGIWVELRGPGNTYASDAFLKKADEIGLTGFSHRCNFDEI